MMRTLQSGLVRYGSRLFALIVISVYALVQPSALSDADRQALASRFSFAAHPLPELAASLKLAVRLARGLGLYLMAWGVSSQTVAVLAHSAALIKKAEQ